MIYVRGNPQDARRRSRRREGIGSSDAGAIMGVSPWAGPRKLWEVLTGRARPEEPTFAMRRGLRLKPLARRLYERRTGALMEPCRIRHDLHDWLYASLDGLDLTGRLVLTIKAPNRKDHCLALKGRVPPCHWPQLQHQLAVTGAPRLHYVSYSENRAFADKQRLAVVEVVPDRAYQAQLLYREWCFWGCVLLDYWPDEQVDAHKEQTCLR